MHLKTWANYLPKKRKIGKTATMIKHNICFLGTKFAKVFICMNFKYTKLKFQFRKFDYFCQIHEFEIHEIEIRDFGISPERSPINYIVRKLTSFMPPIVTLEIGALHCQEFDNLQNGRH